MRCRHFKTRDQDHVDELASMLQRNVAKVSWKHFFLFHGNAASDSKRFFMVQIDDVTDSLSIVA